MLKQIKADDNLTQVIANINFETTFSDIYMIVEALQNGVVAPDQASFNGRIRYTKRGEVMVDVKPQFMRFYNNFRGGSNVVTLSAADNGANKYIVRIPRYAPGDKNVEHVTPGDLATLEWTFGSTLATRADTGDVRFFVEEAEGVSLYDYMFKNFSQSLAANQALVVPISQDNINEILLAAEDANGIPTLAAAEAIDDGRVILSIGGRQYQALVEDYQTYTTLNHQLEVTADNADAAFIYDASKIGLVQANGMADTAQLTIINGAAADVASILVCGRRFANTNNIISEQRNAEFRRQQADAARSGGKSTKLARLSDLGVV